MVPFRRRPSGELDMASSRTSGVLRAERRTVSSGQYSMPPAVDPLATTVYGKLRAILLRYFSPILVGSVLTNALGKRGLSPTTLLPLALGELIGDMMVGLRLFVDEKKLPELMLELAELVEEEHP